MGLAFFLKYLKFNLNFYLCGVEIFNINEQSGVGSFDNNFSGGSRVSGRVGVTCSNNLPMFSNFDFWSNQDI